MVERKPGVLWCYELSTDSPKTVCYARCEVGGARCAMPDARCPMPDAKAQTLCIDVFVRVSSDSVIVYSRCSVIFTLLDLVETLRRWFPNHFFADAVKNIYIFDKFITVDANPKNYRHLCRSWLIDVSCAHVISCARTGTLIIQSCAVERRASSWPIESGSIYCEINQHEAFLKRTFGIPESQ